MIFQGDLIIKTAIELGLDDIRKNPWIIEDIFSDLIENPILNKKYGMEEINRAKEFITNNNIPILMKLRIDSEEVPSITIAMKSSKEKSMGTLGDMSDYINEYSPNSINKPIPFIMKPTSDFTYDKATGVITFKNDISFISEGMVLIDTSTGNGLVIQSVVDVNNIRVLEGSPVANEIAVIPRYPVYRSRVERNWSEESYSIGCHASDPSTLIFLFSIVKYSLYRYKESLLEHENFQLSSISTSDMSRNNNFIADNVYSRYITLSGQIEETWIKATHRVIESASFNGNISILSNENGGGGSDPWKTKK